MDENLKIEMRKLGITERAIMLAEESEKFVNENEDFVHRGVHNEEDSKKMKEFLEKVDWYGREIDIEFRKTTDLLDEYVVQLEKKKDDYIHIYG
jgi:hypothetical protein